MRAGWMTCRVDEGVSSEAMAGGSRKKEAAPQWRASNSPGSEPSVFSRYHVGCRKATAVSLLDRRGAAPPPVASERWYVQSRSTAGGYAPRGGRGHSRGRLVPRGWERS